MPVTKHLGGAFATEPVVAATEAQFQIDAINVLTTTLTANATASVAGAISATASAYYEMIVTPGAFTLDIPAAWDPDSNYTQPATATPFVLAIRILPGNVPRFVGVA